LREAIAEFRVEDLVQGHLAGCVLVDRFVRVPGDAVAQAAQTASGGGDLGFQQFAYAGADCEVAAADDALGDAAWTVAARGAHCGDASDELDFSQCGHLAWAVLAIHRAAFQEDSRDDVVPAADVGQEFRQQIATPVRRVPEMVVRVDDRQIGPQRCLGRALR
jgi:hypothetical protein